LRLFEPQARIPVAMEPVATIAWTPKHLNHEYGTHQLYELCGRVFLGKLIFVRLIEEFPAFGLIWR
jgi:hypothetical protein